MNKQKVIQELQGSGYTVPEDAKFYKISSHRKKYDGCIGMKVGNFEHSCHIDSTDFVVLLMIDLGGAFVDYFDDLDLTLV